MLSFLLPLLALAPMASANTPISNATLHQYLSASGGLELALLSRPFWHFPIMRPALHIHYRPTCYASSALDAAGNQHGNQPDGWPDADTGCVDPGPVGPGKSFPTYYTVTKCKPDEVRIVYNLYFQHDGFSDVLVAKGHEHDWERVVVIWRQQGDGSWKRHRALFSWHGGYGAGDWAKLANTFDFGNTAENGGKDKDGFKVFVGWAKHAMFQNRETGWRDSISQGCQREYRSNDWWYMPTRQDMIWTGKGSPEWQRLSKFNWGSATGMPWVIEEGICGKEQGGFTPC